MMKDKFLKEPLITDTQAKTLFASPDYINITTMLVSKVLNINYQKLKGHIELLPLSIPNKRKKDKKTERDLVVLVNLKEYECKILFEFNYFGDDLDKLFKNIEFDFKTKNSLDEIHRLRIERNIYYLHQVAGRGLIKKDSYKKIIPTILVNLNTFSYDTASNREIDNYMIMNERGLEYTKNVKIIDINIAECYKRWYNFKYQESMFDKEIILLGAMLATTKMDEIERCIEELDIEEDVKEDMLEVINTMDINDLMLIDTYDSKEEKERLNRSYMEAIEEGLTRAYHEKWNNEGRAEGIASKERDMVISLNEQHVSLDIIAKAAKISINKVKQIIDSYLKNKK